MYLLVGLEGLNFSKLGHAVGKLECIGSPPEAKLSKYISAKC